MQEEVIAVVVPLYNVEKYIGRCIESIIAQTYTNIRIFLVDDGSTDSSGEICRHYASKDTRIAYFYREHSGVSEARNFVMGKVKEKYISFVDADDYISKYYIEYLYENLIKGNADISIGKVARGCVGKEPAAVPKRKKLRSFSREEALFALYNKKISLPFTLATTKLYKTELLSDVRFPKGRNYEDVVTAHLVYSRAEKIVYEDVDLYYYTIREGSITQSEQFISDDVILAVRDRMQFLEAGNCPALRRKSREYYLMTLMGAYARVHSDTCDVSERKKELYGMVKSECERKCRERISFLLRLRIAFFLAFPNAYSRLLCRIK